MALKKREDTLKESIDDKIDNMTFASQQKKKPTEIGADDDSITIRIPKEQKELLRKHFKQMGLGLSGGLRMVVYKYMEKNI